jgi:hypothetical protein
MGGFPDSGANLRETKSPFGFNRLRSPVRTWLIGHSVDTRINHDLDQIIFANLCKDMA